ncbi:hypothetical protein NQ314_004451 [Rhamnusium bicolor]|uniref:Phosphomevalonate kinase n=1 Tax=Rhamnusium bicolor TaxID=1586634 RepID=A0AAV8ZLP7_9CUCU|nr:hypothetical protein NQ314_004451 [Rhamnusium bicolor]
MGNGPYKEKYRLDMINWSDQVRNEDPGYFCKAACNSGVDDVNSECDLDDYREWDLQVNNNNNEELNGAIEKILAIVKEAT